MNNSGRDVCMPWMIDVAETQFPRDVRKGDPHLDVMLIPYTVGNIHTSRNMP